jgi:hypothetical protein
MIEIPASCHSIFEKSRAYSVSIIETMLNKRVASLHAARSVISVITGIQPLRVQSFCAEAPRIMYEGQFTDKIQMLRRVSLFSSVTCGSGLTLLLLTSSSDILPIGQIAVVSTALTATFSSTFFLRVFTHPYVISLVALESKDSDNLLIKATRLNIFGNKYTSQFRLNEIERVNSVFNPFASFAANGQYYYVLCSGVEDPVLKKRLSFK